jgi:hypothetical protein
MYIILHTEYQCVQYYNSTVRTEYTLLSYRLQYNEYRVSFQSVKRPGRGVDHLPHLAPRLKKE